MVIIPEAEAFGFAEGITGTRKRRARPGTSACRLWRGLGRSARTRVAQEPREISSSPARTGTAARGSKRAPREDEKSERCIGAMKWGNPPRGPCGAKSSARSLDPSEGKMTETQSSSTVSTRLERIAKLARERPKEALTTLAHHIDVEWLREAYRRTRKDGARGVDGQSAEEYAEHLEENLRSLLDRMKSGTYRAPPVRRVHIPKGDGSETRPIGIPTFEDKVLQRAVAMVLQTSPGRVRNYWARKRITRRSGSPGSVRLRSSSSRRRRSIARRSGAVVRPTARAKHNGPR
jgi:hypothetical protein